MRYSGRNSCKVGENLNSWMERINFTCTGRCLGSNAIIYCGGRGFDMTRVGFKFVLKVAEEKWTEKQD